MRCGGADNWVPPPLSSVLKRAEEGGREDEW